MEIRLVQGQFSKEQSIELLTKLMEVKIKFHEDKIQGSHSEEDMKMRENRIINLQRELAEARNFISELGYSVQLASTILIHNKINH